MHIMYVNFCYNYIWWISFSPLSMYFPFNLFFICYYYLKCKIIVRLVGTLAMCGSRYLAYCGKVLKCFKLCGMLLPRCNRREGSV